MANRYNRTKRIINNSEKYEDYFKSRNLKSPQQYSTFNFGELKDIESYNLNFLVHEVQPFEKLFMISQKYYNSPEYGWLICYTNKLPNELFVQEGVTLNIYFPLERVLELAR